MTSLLDQLKANKDKTKQTTIGPNGQLLSSSTVGIQQQASNLGQPVPSQPLTTGAMTGNPDQAKMAGTPNQLAGAQAANLDLAGKTLTEQKQSSFQAGETAQDELNKQAQVKQLEQLGDLAPRVQQLINLSVKQAEDTSTGPTMLAKTGLSTALTDDLNAFAQGDKTRLPKIAKALNKDALDLNYDDLKALYQDQDGSVIDSIIKSVPDSIKVSPSLLGPQVNMQDLSSTLGVDASTLTISQLNDRLTQYFNQQQFNVEQLKARARNPNTGAAEREEIYAHLRELGVQGEEGVAQRASELEDQVDSGLSVQFNGKTYSVDSLLADSNVSQMVKEYLDNPNSSAAQELAKYSPELIHFVDRNRQALVEAAQKTETTTSTVKDTIRSNRDLAVINGGQAINNDLMASVFGQDWQNSTEKLDLSTAPALAYLHDPKADPSKVANLSVSLNQLQNLNPSIAKQALGMSPGELERLGLTQSPNQPDSAVAIYKLALGIKPRIDALSGSEQDPERILEALLGHDLDGDTDSVVSDYGFIKALGLGASAEADQVQDTLAHWQDLKGMDTDNLGSMYDRLKGKNIGGLGTGLARAKQLESSTEFQALKPYLADNMIVPEEASQLTTDLGPTQAISLLSKLRAGSGSPLLEHSKDIGIASATDALFAAAASIAQVKPERMRLIQSLPNEANKDDYTALQSMIRQLESNIPTIGTEEGKRTMKDFIWKYKSAGDQIKNHINAPQQDIINHFEQIKARKNAGEKLSFNDSMDYLQADKKIAEAKGRMV